MGHRGKQVVIIYSMLHAPCSNGLQSVVTAEPNWEPACGPERPVSLKFQHRRKRSERELMTQ